MYLQCTLFSINDINIYTNTYTISRINRIFFTRFYFVNFQFFAGFKSHLAYVGMAGNCWGWALTELRWSAQCCSQSNIFCALSLSYSLSLCALIHIFFSFFSKLPLNFLGNHRVRPFTIIHITHARLSYSLALIHNIPNSKPCAFIAVKLNMHRLGQYWNAFFLLLLLVFVDVLCMWVSIIIKKNPNRIWMEIDHLCIQYAAVQPCDCHFSWHRMAPN